MTTNNCRLYVFTGKGGVGKTTLSLSFAKFLQLQGKKVLISTLEANSLSSLYQELAIPFEVFDIYQSIKIYLGRKFGSSTVAAWISETPFFKAMLNIVPGFSYLIYLGQIIDYLEHDPELTIILDSPSSGHVLTIFDSLHIFNDIFQVGILVEDIRKMIKRINQSDFLKIVICTIPSWMALQEAIELKEKLSQLGPQFMEISVNDCLSEDKILIENLQQLPWFLKKKIDFEKEVLNHFKNEIKTIISHEAITNYKDLISTLAKEPSVKNFL